MIPGTTPTHTFKIPFDASIIKDFKVIYVQDDVTILEKRVSDCALDGYSVKVTLTQEETFLFKPQDIVEIQLRVLTLGGEVLASIPEKVGVAKCLDKEVLV